MRTARSPLAAGSPARRTGGAVSRLVAAASVAALSCAGLSALPTAAFATPAVDVPDPILHYSFDDAASADAGASIPDTAGTHPGTVMNAGASLVQGMGGAEDLALSLPGTGSGSGGAHVQIAPGLLTSASNDVTMSAWLKWNSAQTCAWAYSMGASSNNYVFFTPSCGNNKIGAIKNGSEVRATGSGALAVGQWAHVSVVVKGGESVALFVNGREEARSATAYNASTAVGTSAFTGYLGRSLYSADPYWNGVIDDFRVYDQALDGDQLTAVAADSEGGAAAMVQADADALSVPGIASSDLTLPTAGRVSDIVWSSSDPTAIAADGTVNRGTESVKVTLTATLTGPGGATSTREFTVTVPASASADQIADGLTIPSVLAKGEQLPVRAGGQTVDWDVAEGDVVLTDGVIDSAPAQGMADVVLTATVDFDGDVVTRTFRVRIVEDSANSIAAYTTSSTIRGVNDPELTRTGHLALSRDGGAYAALNTGAGVVFPEVSGMSETSNGTKQYMATPHLFRLAGDQGFGMIALRTDSAGNVRAADAGSALVFTSPDLVQWTEVGMIQLDTAALSAVAAEWDQEQGVYRIIWTDAAGTSFVSASTDLRTASVIGEGQAPASRSVDTGVTYAVDAMSVPLTADEAAQVDRLLGRVANTTIDAPEAVSIEAGAQLTLPEKVTANYTDGGTHEFRVDWDASEVDTNTPGTYTVTGTLQQTLTQFPLISNRADPHVLRYERGDGVKKWLYISTDDAGQDEFFVRESDTLEGIRTAADNRILGYGLNGSSVNSQLWAPEFHEVDGSLYILFAANSNNVNAWNGVQCYTMRLRDGGNPVVREDWETPQRVIGMDGSHLTEYGSGISLDMTYFKDGDTEYVMWSERMVNPSQPAVLKIATVQSSATGPWQLTSEKVIAALPNDGWSDNTTEVVEGPFAIQRNGKVMITFSGSGVDPTYAVGLLTANSGDDLLDMGNWTKKTYPIWSNEGAFANNWGPGHNSYTYDDDGNLINIFHAKLTSGGTRDAGARMVYFRTDDSPILDMTDEEWLAPANRTVSLQVTVEEPVAPALDITVKATQRCVAGKVALVSSVTNGSDQTVTASVQTAYGKKSITVAPGKTVSNAFSSRLADIPAGQVSVTATAGDAGVDTSAEYPAYSCR